MAKWRNPHKTHTFNCRAVSVVQGRRPTQPLSQPIKKSKPATNSSMKTQIAYNRACKRVERQRRPTQNKDHNSMALSCWKLAFQDQLQWIEATWFFLFLSSGLHVFSFCQWTSPFYIRAPSKASDTICLAFCQGTPCAHNLAHALCTWWFLFWDLNFSNVDGFRRSCCIESAFGAWLALGC